MIYQGTLSLNNYEDENELRDYIGGETPLDFDGHFTFETSEKNEALRIVKRAMEFNEATGKMASNVVGFQSCDNNGVITVFNFSSMWEIEDMEEN